MVLFMKKLACSEEHVSYIKKLACLEEHMLWKITRLLSCPGHDIKLRPQPCQLETHNPSVTSHVGRSSHC